MTRKKKNRKGGQLAATKEVQPAYLKGSNNITLPKKKGKGNKAGSRHNIDTKAEKTTQTGGSNHPYDSRVGSTRPIPLDPADVEIPTFQPKAAIKKVEPVRLSPAKELEAIEADDRLNALLDLLDNGEELTGKDQKYFNKQMARHAELLTILGLDEDDSKEKAEENVIQSDIQNLKQLAKEDFDFKDDF